MPAGRLRLVALVLDLAARDRVECLGVRQFRVLVRDPGFVAVLLRRGVGGNALTDHRDGSGGEGPPKLGRFGQVGELAMERESPRLEGGLEQGEELAPEEAAEDADWQEESRWAGDPA